MSKKVDSIPVSECKGFNDLLKDVITTGLCTLCGTCAGICPRQAIEMRIEDYEKGEPSPVLIKKCGSCSACYEICAGKSVPLADLDRFVFGRERNLDEEPLGIFRRSIKGFAEGRLRAGSSSGGLTLGVVAYALEEGLIDAALVAVRSKEHPWRTEAGIITSAKDTRHGVRSVMEMVPVNSALHDAVIKKGFRKIGIVGLPCQIHSLRKLQMRGKPKRLADAVVFSIGLYCNSTAYYIGIEHLIKEIGGIEFFNEIIGMDYRAGDWPGSMMVAMDDGKIYNIAGKSVYGSFLSIASYRRDRCLMCTDFSAESADISIGDIFQVVGDNRRWSGAIIRTAIGEKLIDGALTGNFIHVESHDPELVPASGYGWEMSKHANMYRLEERKKHGWPVPDFQYPSFIKLMRRSLSSSSSAKKD